MPALPEAIPAPMPKLLPVRPGNLLSGVGCQLEIITNATAARNEAMMILRIEGSRDETRTPDSMLPTRSDSSNFLTRCHCTIASYIEHKRPMQVKTIQLNDVAIAIMRMKAESKRFVVS